MEPQTPQIPTVGTSNQNNNLDLQALALTKAIGQTEGGDFSASGKSGEYGAYQFLPGTWQSASQAAGVNAPLEQATPEQQNEVAYKRVKSFKDQGFNPGQIASMWNAGEGEPDAYLGTFSDGEASSGVHSGVPFNVPTYVDKVMNAYGKLNANNPLSQVSQTNVLAPSSPVSQSGRSDWLTPVVGSIGLAGLAGLALPWLAGPEAGIPADIAETAATTGEAATEAAPGILSKLVGYGKSALKLGLEALGIKGGEDIVGQVLNGGKEQLSSSDTGTSQQQQQSSDISGGGGLGESAIASKLVNDAINGTMQGTQSNRVFSQNPSGQQAIQTSATFGLINPDEEGILHFDEQKRQNLLSEVSNLQDKIIAAEGTTNSPLAVANYAGNFIGNDRLNTALDKQKAAKIVRQELKADSGRIPLNGQMSLSAMRTAQKAHYQAAKASYLNPKPNSEMLAHKALGNAYGKAIRDKMENPELYDRAKKMEQNLINVSQLKKRVEGKKAPVNNSMKKFLLTQFARAAEIYIGDKIGGTVGALIGGFVGESLNRKIGRHFGRNIFETKSMRAAMDVLKDTKPKEYQMLVNALKKQGIDATNKSEAPQTTKGKIKDIKKDLDKMGKTKGLIPIPGKGNTNK